MTFNRNYFLIALAIFIIEVFIALFVRDRIVRPYIGDILVVILVYCFVKSFLNFPVTGTAISVLLFAFGVETLQYFHFINRIGLHKSPLAIALMGNSFAWIDLITYVIGIMIVVAAEIYWGNT